MEPQSNLDIKQISSTFNGNRRMKILSIVVVIIVFVILALFSLDVFKTGFPSLITTQNKASQIRAKVGSLVITEKDIEYEIGIERAYGNSDLTSEIALQTLIRESTEQEVAKSVGILPTEKDIADFENHANTSTKAPEILNAVKVVFGIDNASYVRVYLLPKIINVELHSFFDANAELQKGDLSSVQKALKEVIDGKKFEDVANEEGLQYMLSDFSSLAIPPSLSTSVESSAQKINAQKSKIFEIVESLKPGEISKTIFEDIYAFSVVRLISVDNGMYTIELISSNKNDYGAWYKGEAKKIIVELVK